MAVIVVAVSTSLVKNTQKFIVSYCQSENVRAKSGELVPVLANPLQNTRTFSHSCKPVRRVDKDFPILVNQ